MTSLAYGLLVPLAVAAARRVHGWRRLAAVFLVMLAGLPLLTLAIYAGGVGPGLTPG